MANANTEHSKKLRQATAQKWQREKLKSGEYKQFSVQGKAEDVDVILAAIGRAGGSRVQALKKICAEFLARSE